MFDGSEAAIREGRLLTLVDAALRTSAPGVFAIGNVVHPVDTADVAPDPMRLEVMNGLYMHVAEQMGVVLRQTASSVNIKERLDYSCALFDGAARIQPYVLNFVYPAQPVGPEQAAIEKPARYELKGERSLWPESIADDGQFTSLRWAEDAALPAIYQEDAQGNLALVNGLMRDGVFVSPSRPSASARPASGASSIEP